MSGLAFVCDADGRPLMPMAAAYARRLLQSGKAMLRPHYAFTVVQLTQTIAEPVLRPVLLGIAIHLHSAELFLLAEGDDVVFPLLSVVVDLRTDLTWRLRRRASHRRRRRGRGRYRRIRQHGQAYARRRPGLIQPQRRSMARRATTPSQESQRIRVAPTIRWRVQALSRVVASLQSLVPISAVLIIRPANSPLPADRSLSPSERRQGARARAGGAFCAYCGTCIGQIGVDHMLPRSRGGTDAQSNLVLACAACNARKGGRTPAEAAMEIGGAVPALARLQRARPYAQKTARHLVRVLSSQGVAVSWQPADSGPPSHISTPLYDGLTAFAARPTEQAPLVVAKPISRPRKQIYTARNYPATTPLTASFERVKGTVKRRIRVNYGLACWQRDGQTTIRVVSAAETPPADADILVTVGMLCEGRSAGRTVAGIVSAIYSDGRLALLRPATTQAHSVAWKRSIIRPWRHLRVLSTDTIIFFSLARP